MQRVLNLHWRDNTIFLRITCLGATSHFGNGSSRAWTSFAWDWNRSGKMGTCVTLPSNPLQLSVCVIPFYARKTTFRYRLDSFSILDWYLVSLGGRWQRLSWRGDRRAHFCCDSVTAQSRILRAPRCLAVWLLLLSTKIRRNSASGFLLFTGLSSLFSSCLCFVISGGLVINHDIGDKSDASSSVVSGKIFVRKRERRQRPAKFIVYRFAKVSSVCMLQGLVFLCCDLL